MKEYIGNILGIITGGSIWVLMRDVSIAIAVAFITGYAAYYGGVLARKTQEWRRKSLKKQKIKHDRNSK